jgi:hypothetical protein
MQIIAATKKDYVQGKPSHENLFIHTWRSVLLIVGGQLWVGVSNLHFCRRSDNRRLLAAEDKSKRSVQATCWRIVCINSQPHCSYVVSGGACLHMFHHDPT